MDCVVRNLSETGALVLVERPFGISDSVTLLLDERQRFECRVVRRSAKDIGLEVTAR